MAVAAVARRWCSGRRHQYRFAESIGLLHEAPNPSRSSIAPGHDDEDKGWGKVAAGRNFWEIRTMPVYMTVWEGAAEVALGDVLQFAEAAIDGADSAAIIEAEGSPRRRRRVRLYSTAAVFVAWGETPTPTDSTNGMALGADNPEYVDIQAGHVLAAVSR